MIEIGTDLVLVSRMEKSLQIPGFAERVFSEPERVYCKTTESFAGILPPRRPTTRRWAPVCSCP